MAIQDSDPERRNLMVTAIAFIAYFYAGGSFPETSVKLQVINANFSRPGILGFIVWAAFVWFIYRYWQTHSGIFSKEFVGEFSRWQTKSYIKKYASVKVGQDLVTDQDEGYHVNGISWKNKRVEINCVYAKNIGRDEEGRIQSYSQVMKEKKNDVIPMSGFKGWWFAIRATAECILKYPSFSSYVVPYILSVIAISGALGRYVF